MKNDFFVTCHTHTFFHIHNILSLKITMFLKAQTFKNKRKRIFVSVLIKVIINQVKMYVRFRVQLYTKNSETRILFP